MSKKITLKNGIRTYLTPISGTDAATILILFKVGSRFEKKNINGAAHYIEHMMFKGTKKRPTTLDISRELDSFGAEYNAYTGKDLTGYYIKIDGEKFEAAIEMLYDMLFNSRFEQEELSRERHVIIEEIKMYRDNPLMYSEDLLESALFEGSSLGWHIAGSPKTMLGMTRKQVLEFRDAFYTPNNMVISIAGEYDKNTTKLLNATFGKIKNSARAKNKFGASSNFKAIREPKAVVQLKKTEQAQLAIGFRGIPYNDKRIPAVQILANILGGTMSSRLFVEVRERRGLAYFVRASHSSYDDTGAFLIQSGLNHSKIRDAVKVIMRVIEDIKKNGVTAEELKRAKDNIHGSLMLALEDSSRRAEWYGRQELFLGTALTPEARLKEYDKVELKDVQSAANDVLNGNSMAIAGIGQFKSKNDLLKYF